MTPYVQQWGRIMALFKAGRIARADLDILTARHQKWFSEQHRSDATIFMVQDLQRFAEPIEQLGAAS